MLEYCSRGLLAKALRESHEYNITHLCLCVCARVQALVDYIYIVGRVSVSVAGLNHHRRSEECSVVQQHPNLCHTDRTFQKITPKITIETKYPPFTGEEGKGRAAV